ncbi:hypothetical protein J1771_gp58 [Gordonia phage MelBins]|uniref:Uncharacterized protein n=1 Tax=Gordonia phage MelBins TaxID=2656540 RepID=A0A649VNV0_9CAUD|nr:hypothetical protein J1771_gp58 [Gordonia phage MelBins]QGJ93612.1 hypothetical protein SEA_MELBINS_58 [Gordonia phage MelBins]
MTLFHTPDGTPYRSFTLCAICHRAIGELVWLRYGDARQRPHDRQWQHVASTDETHPARVPWDAPDEPTPPPLDLTIAVARMTAAVEVSLRQLLDLVGVPYTEPIVEAKRQFAPHHLDAMREAWAEGYDDGHANGRRKYDGAPENPYGKLLDDRREFVREQVENGYGALVTDDDEFVLGDDNAEWFDAVLDAHDEWLALSSESRVKPEHPQPGAWQPPYSADEALRRIWNVINHGGLRDDFRLAGVREILDDMGYHEHVHTRLATEPDRTTIPPTMPQCGETQGREQTFDGRSLICHLPTGHDGLHMDGVNRVTWS